MLLNTGKRKTKTERKPRTNSKRKNCFEVTYDSETYHPMKNYFKILLEILVCSRFKLCALYSN